MCEDLACGRLGKAVVPVSSHETGLGAELTWQLHAPVYVLAGEVDRLNLILHWLAHTRVKSEATPRGVS